MAVIDGDRGFMRVVANRLDELGGEYRMLDQPASAEALVAMRCNALVVDIAVLGSAGSTYLEQVCAELPRLAVIVCTAPSPVQERISGLRLGADAWISKPCHALEVVSIVEACVRRHRRHELKQPAATTMVGPLTIRPDLHQVYAGEVSLDLTVREFDILRLLTQTDGVLRRHDIYETVWGWPMFDDDRSVDVFVRKLRRKLRAASPQWRYIHTHVGIGYRFAPERERTGFAAEPERTAEREEA